MHSRHLKPKSPVMLQIQDHGLVAFIANYLRFVLCKKVESRPYIREWEDFEKWPKSHN